MLGLRVILAGKPTDIALLDEPWEGLDPSGGAWLIDTLRLWRAAGSAILISSHRLYDLDSVCTRFVMLEGGRCQPIVRRTNSTNCFTSASVVSHEHIQRTTDSASFHS